MCGIVGLFLKDRSLEPKLGAMLTDMLITMTDRGPDSAGIAIFGSDADSVGKLTVQSANASEDFKNLDNSFFVYRSKQINNLFFYSLKAFSKPIKQAFTRVFRIPIRSQKLY